MSDPLTTLMHAVQVMNLLKTLIMKTLKEHEQTTTGLLLWIKYCLKSDFPT